MDLTTFRALTPILSTVVVIVAGAVGAHARLPGPTLVVAAVAVLLAAAVVATACRRPRRREDLDAEWAATEPAWRHLGSGHPER